MSLRFRPTMRRRPVPPLPPLEMPPWVHLRGHDVAPEFVEANAQEIMDGFDELPRKIRDRINYAPTPEGGALAVWQLVGNLLTRTRSRR